MNTYLRQNHKEALAYLKASAYCFKKERVVTYIIIVLSVLLCFTGIFNRYISFFIKDVSKEYLDNMQDQISRIINLVSGTFIICQIFINKQMRQTHRMGVNLMERYDCYVYDLPMNKVITMPVNGSDVEVLARKIKRKQNQYYNYYFSSSVEAESKSAVFDNQYKIYKNEYKLMNYVKPFFMVIWVSFVVSIVVLAASFDDKFIFTLINTMIPSLSIISIIMGSATSFNETLSKLQNGINVMDAQRDLSKNAKEGSTQVKLNSNQLLRNIQDGLFNVRQNDFTIPVYFKKRFNRYEQKMSWETPIKTHRTFKEYLRDLFKPKRIAKEKTEEAFTTKKKNNVKTNNSTKAINTNTDVKKTKEVKPAATKAAKEIKPIVEDKKPIEEVKIIDEVKPKKTAKAVKEPKAVEKEVNVDETKPKKVVSKKKVETAIATEIKTIEEPAKKEKTSTAPKKAKTKKESVGE